MTSDGFLFSGRGLFFRSHWEAMERRLVSELLPGMDLFINFGANHGYYCCLAAKHGVRTLAFEPVAENCMVIARNMRANGWEGSCSLFPVAVSSYTGFAEIHAPARTERILDQGLFEGFPPETADGSRSQDRRRDPAAPVSWQKHPDTDGH